MKQITWFMKRYQVSQIKQWGTGFKKLTGMEERKTECILIKDICNDPDIFYGWHH